MKIIITLSTLTAFLLEQKGHLPNLLKSAFDFEDNPKSSVGQYFGETTNWGMLNEACKNAFNFDGETITMEYNDNNGPMPLNSMLKPIHEFSNWVQRSYDNENYPWEKNAWEEEYCSGDDDVDYNSSYLDCCIAMIELYCLVNKLTYHEFTTYCTKEEFTL